jgi:methionyl aminopeptidase
VVKEYCGHGIGRKLHEDPPILNYGKPGQGIVLVKNMTICIEPMVCAGSGKVKVLKDGWTVVSEDGSISAHFEHTVRVGEEESEILTQ